MKSLSFLEKSILFLLLVSSFILNALPGFSRLSICLAALFLFFIFLKERKVFLIKNYLLPFIFLAFNMFSLLWGGNVDYVMQVSSAVIIGYAVFVGLRYDMPTSLLLWTMALAAAVNIVFSYQNILYFQGTEADRIAGLSGNANGLAILLSFIAFFLYFLARKRNFLIKCIVFFLLFFVLFYTGSRKGLLLVGMIMLFFGMDYLMWQKAKMRSQRFIIVFLVLMLFLGFCFKKFYETSKDIVAVQRAEELLRGEDLWSAQTRYLMIDEGIKLWLAKPVFGWGGGGFAKNSGFGTYSHNNYTEILSNYGITGFCLYYSFYVYLFMFGWKLRREYLPRIGLFVVLMFFILGWGFVSLADKASWIFLGISAHCMFPYKKEQLK